MPSSCSGVVQSMGSLMKSILLLILAKFLVSEAFCPVKCDCSTKDLLYCQDLSIKDLAKLAIPHNFSFVHISGTQVDKVTNDSFQEMPITLRLNLESNQISTITSGAFQDFPLLKSLKLSSNRLDSLPRGVFHSLTDLEQLFLDRNLLSSLDPHLFKNLRNLTELTLNRNRLKVLPDELFTHQINLKILNLSKNKLSRLPKDIFNSLHILTSLMLYENLLPEIPHLMFQNLTELVKLSLYSNKIKVIDEETFYHVPQLRELSLHRNELQTLADGLFLYVNKLEKLFLFDNPLTHLPNILFGKMDLLRSLWLYNTYLSTIPNFIFSNLTNLEILILTRNHHLHSLPSNAFNGLHSLVELSLHTNNITSLPDDIFQNLPSLRILSLYNNNFDGLSENLFNALVNLETVNLNNSKIRTLPGNIFSSVPTLQTVHLDGNPWMCDCRLQEFKLWLVQNVEKVYNTTSLVCQTPSTLTGMPLLVVDELVCPYSTVYNVDYHVLSTPDSSMLGFTSMTTSGAEMTSTTTAHVINAMNVSMTDSIGHTAKTTSPSLPSNMEMTTVGIVLYNASHHFHPKKFFGYYLPCGKIMYCLVLLNLTLQIFYIIVTCLSLLKIRNLYKYFRAFKKPVVLVRMLIPLTTHYQGSK